MACSGAAPPAALWLMVTSVFAGIGMDTCVIPLRHGGLSLVQTTDYIYPIVDDPYMMVSWTLACSHICSCCRLVLGCGGGRLVFMQTVLIPPQPCWLPWEGPAHRGSVREQRGAGLSAVLVPGHAFAQGPQCRPGSTDWHVLLPWTSAVIPHLSCLCPEMFPPRSKERGISSQCH